MEYVQERVTTLHDFGGARPVAPTDDTAVVVPLTVRDLGSPAAERVFERLAAVDPATVVVALRASRQDAADVTEWLADFDCPLTVLWCNAPPVERLLSEHGLGGVAGKGRDVWLALGVATRRAEYVVVHDADAESYTEAHVPRLVFPLARGYDFSKGYYARVEDGRFYGRLFRLFYRPLLRALSTAHDAPVLSYLDAFRYALAGEFAATASLARQLRLQPGWGLEVGTLGDAFAAAGFAGSAQVDLGVHVHEHRPVDGEGGLGAMAREVGQALFRVVEDGGVVPDYETLPERYRRAATALIDQYATDAAFNGLHYDADDERRQVAAYADAVALPGRDERLPAWDDVALDSDAVAERAGDALALSPER
jgi:glucosyl-3-phosphoglycerate synthase